MYSLGHVPQSSLNYKYLKNKIFFRLLQIITIRNILIHSKYACIFLYCTIKFIKYKKSAKNRLVSMRRFIVLHKNVKKCIDLCLNIKCRYLLTPDAYTRFNNIFHISIHYENIGYVIWYSFSSIK